MNKDDSSLPLVVALILAIGLVAVAALVYRSRQASLMTMEAQYQAEAAATQASIRALDQARQSRLESPPLATTPESSTSQRARVDRESLDVLVLDPTGAPVSEATLILFREQSILAQGSTDATGLAHFVAQEGSGEYLIAATGWDFVHGEFELSSGRRTVNLVEGAVVAGTVLVDGLAPSAPMELSWNSNRNLSDRIGTKALPRAVLIALHATRDNVSAIVARTNADGTFAFRGLTADVGGFIQWSEPYFPEVHELYNDDRVFSVPVPKRDLLLRLIAGIELRLRVVDPQGAAMPMAGVSLVLEQTSRSGSGSTSVGSGCDSEGRFVHALTPDYVFDKLSVTVVDSEGAGARIHEFARPPNLRGVWDLGDLATRATHSLSVLVQDTAGQPIPDAQVLPSPGPRSNPKHPTDAEGRVVIQVGVDDIEIVAHAFGYMSARTAFAADAADVIVTLAQACVLDFEMPGYTGKRDSLVLELQGPSPLFAGDKTTREGPLKTDSGGFNSNGKNGITTIEVRPNKSGTWRISGLMPNQAMQARLRGGSKELCSVEIAPLSEGEKRIVPMQVDEEGKSLRVRVLSPTGRRVSSAEVDVIDMVENFGPSRRGNADSNGEIEIKSLFGDRCSLRLRAAGFAWKCVTLHPIPSDPVDVVLDPALSVEIALVRQDGSAVLDEAQVWLESYGAPVERATALDQGRYRLDNLPGGDALIIVNGSFGSVSRLIDGSAPFARIVVGDSFLSVRISGVSAKDLGKWSVAVAERGSNRDVTRVLLRTLALDGGACGIRGLIRGEYDVWLEKRSDAAMDLWERVGQATPLSLDAEHPKSSIELRPPG